MGSKGPSSGGSTQTVNQPWGPEKPYLKEALRYMQQFLTGQGGMPVAPYNFPNQQVAGFSGPEEQAFGNTAQLATQEGQAFSPSLPLVSNTLSGAYLNPATNPWLTATYNAAAQPLTENYASTVAPGEETGAIQAGAFGGSADAEANALNQYQFGGQLQNLATGIYGGNYQQERQNQLGTLGDLGKISLGLNEPNQQLLDVGGLQQAQQQNVLNTGYENQYNAASWPYQLLSMFTGGGGVGSLGGGAGSSTSTSTLPGQTNSLWQDIAGGAGIGASLLPLLFL
jgi:hypothetical protein